MAGGEGLKASAAGGHAGASLAQGRGPSGPAARWRPSPRRLTALLLALTAAVVIGHLIALDWLARHAPAAQGLAAMPEPVFTRVLAPSAEDPVVVAVPPPAPAPAPVAAREEVIVAATPAPAASAPQPPASAAEASTNPTPPESAPPEPAPSTQRPELAAAPEADVPAPGTAQREGPALGNTAHLANSTNKAMAGGTGTVAAAGNPAPAPAPAPAAAAPTASAPAADPLAALWPVDTRVTYNLSGQFRGGPLYGSARVQWLRQGAQYQARVELSIVPFGSATYTSQGQVTAAGLVPQAFEDARGSRRRLTRFSDKEVVMPDGRTFERPSGVQDMASQFIELGFRFRSGQAATDLGSTLTLPLVRPGAVDTWTYDIFAHELLRTPRMGELDTVRVTPRPFTNARGTLASEIWFAPRLQYLPVRFKVSFGEEAALDLLVESIEQR